MSVTDKMFAYRVDFFPRYHNYNYCSVTKKIILSKGIVESEFLGQNNYFLNKNVETIQT